MSKWFENVHNVQPDFCNTSFLCTHVGPEQAVTIFMAGSLLVIRIAIACLQAHTGDQAYFIIAQFQHVYCTAAIGKTFT